MDSHSVSNCLLVTILAVLAAASTFGQVIIIDHGCTDLTQIPEVWLDAVKRDLRLHYAHTSHGEQVMVGLEQLAGTDARLSYYPDNCTLPDTPDYLSLMDGQYFDGYCETYVTPELYWQGTDALDITRGMLNTHDVNVSAWAWCSQLDYFSHTELQAYLDAVNQLESEYPDVTFVYMTGNAQSPEQTRHDRNEEIRQYCQNNGKVLFDFADLDCWYGNELHTEDGIPIEHPEYWGDEVAHTTFGSCENKARAFWWLLARVAGWDGVAAEGEGEGEGEGEDGCRPPGKGLDGRSGAREATTDVSLLILVFAALIAANRRGTR